MSLTIQNSRALIQPSEFRWKVLLCGKPGTGKTSWAATAAGVGFVACETGHGDGLLSVADAGVDYVLPRTVQDFEAVVNGLVFKDKETLVLDSLSAMTRTFIKEYAISFPRLRGDSAKRRAGVPELDDYGTMGEVTRRLLAALLDLDKNIIVTALERSEKDEDGAIVTIGPDLPGQLFLGAPAMFDTVLYAKTRKLLKDKSDARSAYTEYYLLTENDGLHVGKDRNNRAGKPMLSREELWDKASGRGGFPELFAKILKGYSASG